MIVLNSRFFKVLYLSGLKFGSISFDAFSMARNEL